MLSYKQYINIILNEGIINVNHNLLDFLESIFIYHFLDDIENMMKDKNIENDKVLDTIKWLKIEHDKKRKKHLTKNKNITYSNQSYLGIEYKSQNIQGTFNYHVGSKSINDNTGAYFKISNKGQNNSIHVNYDKELMQKMNMWLSNPELGELELIMKSKRNQIEHELAHLVEWFITNKKFLKKAKSGYNDNEVDYFTSEIEFEPMIISLVRDFEIMIKGYKIKNGHPMSIEMYKQLADDVIKNKPFTEIDNTFLTFSKKITPVKYKRIIRKVYVEMMNNISKLQKEGYLEKDN